MTLLEKAEKQPTKSKGVIALAVLTLGTLGIVAYRFFGYREVRGMDMAMLFVAAAFAAYGTMRTIIRGLLTGVSVYLATAFTGTFYYVLTPYARSFLNLLPMLGLGGHPVGPVDTAALALSFAFATTILWITLELLFRAALPETHITLLGPVDRVGGMLVYLVIGIVIAALLFSILGYGPARRVAHNRASLRPEFNQVIELVYQAQSFWFPNHPPVIYVYDQVSRE